ncbi:hypothetical protein RRF57_004387 [Xylaria bambusicola]|uniref:Uncharacterized protein n=1 Tax=Xylaria bambusicola TaxID=326684 RepID=A0AAN7Z4C5_9PEZI
MAEVERRCSTRKRNLQKPNSHSFIGILHMEMLSELGSSSSFLGIWSVGSEQEPFGNGLAIT